MKDSFDKFQFDGHHQHPVNARRTVDGWVTPGVAFEDYTRMSTQQRKPSGERRLPTPQWAVNDVMLRELIVAFMEERAGYRKLQKGPLLERLARARTAVIAQRPRQLETLEKLCKRYVKLKNFGYEPDKADAEILRIAEEILGSPPLFASGHPLAAREMLSAKSLRALEIQIEAIDTYLRYTENGGADKILAIVYLYYRVGLDSVGVATELGLKPPHIRQTLWRLHDTWDKIKASQQSDTGAATQNGRTKTDNATTADAEKMPPLFNMMEGTL